MKPTKDVPIVSEEFRLQTHTETIDDDRTKRRPLKTLNPSLTDPNEQMYCRHNMLLVLNEYNQSGNSPCFLKMKPGPLPTEMDGRVVLEACIASKTTRLFQKSILKIVMKPHSTVSHQLNIRFTRTRARLRFNGCSQRFY